MADIITWHDGLAIGMAEIDQHHAEFVVLINQMANTSSAEFVSLFTQLQQHLQRHFDEEDRLMQQSKFPATSEHRSEHTRVLGELHQFQRQLERGRYAMARAYIKERLPEWFTLHIATMDSALVAHLKR